jgi:prepilin-type N-terminal cleavage/methylation domain-containing protein
MTRTRTRPRTRSKSRGYTAVEVLIALLLFAIGAAGVIGMLKVTIQGGADARRFDIATNIANEWVGRLQRDATFWTLPNAANPTLGAGSSPGEIGATKWLKDINSSSCDAFANSGAYCTPGGAIPTTAPVGGLSSAYDIVGRDLTASEEAFFCAQYRLSWIEPQTNGGAQCPVPPPGTGTAPCCPGPELCLSALMRADIRVFWKRQEYGSIPDCAAAAPDANPNQYHFVYATTAIRENQIQ